VLKQEKAKTGLHHSSSCWMGKEKNKQVTRAITNNAGSKDKCSIIYLISAFSVIEMRGCAVCDNKNN
jgi:hypothetical protein